MSRVIDLEEARLNLLAKRGFRNWEGHFEEEFGVHTKVSDLSMKTLAKLAQGKEKSNFYLYDLIICLRGAGSGFDLNQLKAKEKMAVIDRYLFLLDRIRFECMKRLGWLQDFPGEEYTIVDLIVRFESLAPGLQAEVPNIGNDHPERETFAGMNTSEKEAFIRKMIPAALKEMENYSTTR